MKKLLSLLCTLVLLYFTTAVTFAASGDIAITSKNIRFSSGSFQEGRTVRIYASVTNNSDQDLLGVVRFFDNGNQINGDQAISIFGNKTDDVFIDWTPNFGNHNILVRIYPWNPEIDDPNNNEIETTVFAVQDTDYDGIPNVDDPDDDGDNVNDEEDDFPLNPHEQYDTDGDGLGGNADRDDDNDEVPDEFDDLPLDPNESIDTDKDGIGNIADTDDDGDGLTDSEEENIGTDPMDADTDDDDANDSTDAFPQDQTEQLDTDQDKLGNNTDTDDDNDGSLDVNDNFPLNKSPIIKLEDENPIVGILDEATFDASPSYDEDGNIESYLWEIEGETYEGNAVTHTFQKPGVYDVKLQIKDNSGESRNTNFQVNVMNLKLYIQLAVTVIAILLALIIFFKYIARAKNSSIKK